MHSATTATAIMGDTSSGMTAATVAVTMAEMTVGIIMAGTVISAAARNGATITVFASAAEAESLGCVTAPQDSAWVSLGSARLG